MVLLAAGTVIYVLGKRRQRRTAKAGIANRASIMQNGQ
jgi:hypothetical protein